MIAVLFEVWPAEGKTQHYLDLAAALREELSGLDGFLSIERFESLSEPGKLFSLSFFRDEQAVALWRNSTRHRATQSKGRSGVFSNYRLRVAHVVRDYGLTDRAQAPDDSRATHDG
jgi:heme-degrading monooxygenase HmoA